MTKQVEGIDQIYCINLDRRPDRWEKMTSQFDYHGLKVCRFSAIDGTELSGEKSYWSSVLGFNISQIKVLEQAVNENHDVVMVIEDDAQLHPEFRVMIERGIEQLPESWGMCYLGGSNMQEPRKTTDDLAVCLETLSTTGYIVKVSFAKDHLLPAMIGDYQSKEVDAIFRDLQKINEIHIFNPRIAYQFEDYSDIQHKTVNYSHQRDF